MYAFSCIFNANYVSSNFGEMTVAEEEGELYFSIARETAISPGLLEA
jgi:hypothetical protein